MMMKRTSTSILSLVLLFSWVAPSYGANKCEKLFTVDLEALYSAELKELVKSHYSIDQKQNLVSNLFLRFGMRQFKLKYMESPKDIRQGVSETEHLFQVASRFSGEYKDLSPEMLWFERRVLAEGIDSLVLKYRDIPESHAVLVLIRKILKSRIVKFAQNFRNLPYRNDKSIPDDLYEKIKREEPPPPLPNELIEKIMKNGPTAHEKELLDYYDSTNQDRIDRYRQVRKIYATFFILLLSYTTWDQLGTIDEKIGEARLKKTLKSLEELDEFMNALNEELARRDLYKD